LGFIDGIFSGLPPEIIAARDRESFPGVKLGNNSYQSGSFKVSLIYLIAGWSRFFDPTAW
jgi:hypothetical protein